MANSKFSFRPQSKDPDKRNENDRSKILIALFFLLLSFSCIFCSSQGALWFINEDRVEASILSNRMADYRVDLAVAAAPLDRDALATEIYQDDILLQQTVTTSGMGNTIVMVMPTLSPPTPIPVAQLLPTLTPTPVPPPTATPNPTSPPTAAAPPTVDPPPTPVPATSTSEPPTPEPPTPIPSTPVLPTPIPPTPIPPTPTDIVPTPTDPPPPPTSIPPPANNPPTAGNDTATTNEDTSVLINVLLNDSDSDGTINPATVTIISGPLNGGVVVNSATGQVTYTPNGNYSGNDTFNYQVCDDDGDCDTATVSITVNPVNDPPLAVDDTSVTPNGLPITIAVLNNDSDPDIGDTLSVIAVGGSSGTIGINTNNTVTYTPTAGITGTHIFTYTIQDSGGLTDSAVVSVTVTTPPVAVDDFVVTAEDIPANIDVLNNDSDLDGDSLTVTFVSGPVNGTATINVPGYTVTYVPDSNYYGLDTFTYIISDGIFTDTAAVNIIVIPVNDPPEAVDDFYSTTVSSTLTILAPGILSNDSDIDGPSLTVTSVSPPSGGSVGVSADGGFIYTAPAIAGVYTFTYQAQDNIGAVSNVATVTIQVTSP